MTGYTSPGAGLSSLPVRFNCPPEVTLFVLGRPADEEPARSRAPRRCRGGTPERAAGNLLRPPASTVRAGRSGGRRRARPEFVLAVPSFSPFEVAAVLIVLAAALGYLNYRFIGLPHTIGLTVTGAFAALAVVGFDALWPALPLEQTERSFLRASISPRPCCAACSRSSCSRVPCTSTSAFCSGAGGRSRRSRPRACSSRPSWSASASRRRPACSASTSSLLWCLVFGALISPTDPVAVLGILRRAGVPELLEAKIGGESLFNDGIGIVLFSILLTAASSNEPVSIAHAGLPVRARGGRRPACSGFAIGGLGFALMKTIDEHNLEILITLAVVMGGYALAQRLHVSGPIAMAVAGLLIGSPGVKYAMSDHTRDNLLNFWSLLDEILNSVLFLTIGLEVVTISIGWPELLSGLLAIPIVLGARAISVGLPAAVIAPVRGLDRGTYPMLVWGGLRGGISIALALTLPAGDMQALLLTATYVVVVFSVAVQGTTVGLAARRLFRPRRSRLIETAQLTTCLTVPAVPSANNLDWEKPDGAHAQEGSRDSPQRALVRARRPAQLRTSLAPHADGPRPGGLDRQAVHRHPQHLVRIEPVPRAFPRPRKGREARRAPGRRHPGRTAGRLGRRDLHQAHLDALPQHAGHGDRGADPLPSARWRRA